MKTLIISDQLKHSQRLKAGLEQHNFAVDEDSSMTNPSFQIRSSEYDAIVLISSDHKKMQKFCREYRQKSKNTPILAVSDTFTAEQALALYESGVDDYASLWSPTSILVIRVKALLRRGPVFQNNILCLGDLELDCSNYTVKRGKKSVNLTKKEFGLLEYLLKHQNQVLSRTTLIEHVWDIGADLFSNSLETHILNLRRKIELPNQPKLIQTISGRGYKITTNS